LVYTGFWFIQGLVYTRFWFIRGFGLYSIPVYSGLWFIQGLVYIGFWLIQGLIYTGFWFIQVLVDTGFQFIQGFCLFRVWFSQVSLYYILKDMILTQMYYLRFRPPPLTPLQGPKLGLNPILSA
jgi:hypothetical protein